MELCLKEKNRAQNHSNFVQRSGFPDFYAFPPRKSSKGIFSFLFSIVFKKKQQKSFKKSLSTISVPINHS